MLETEMPAYVEPRMVQYDRLGERITEYAKLLAKAKKPWVWVEYPGADFLTYQGYPEHRRQNHYQVSWRIIFGMAKVRQAIGKEIGIDD